MSMKWTKKIDEMHIAGKGLDGRTLCGKSMLGNNYATVYPNRKMCKICRRLM